MKASVSSLEGLALSPAAQAICARHNVHLLGQGSQTLLFCNGFNCNQQVWNYLLPTLATRYRLVLYDQIGTGSADAKAYRPDKYASIQGYVDDMLEICRALDLENVILVGHSLGVAVALLASIQAPQYFTKAVLLAASPCYLNMPGYYGGFERADLVALLQEMDRSYRDWAHMFATLLMGQGTSSPLGYELAEYFCESNSDIAKQTVRLAFFDDHRDILPQVQLPVLLVQAADDVAVPAEVNDYWMAHLPHAELVTLLTTGHCPHMSAPREVLAAMRQYIEK